MKKFYPFWGLLAFLLISLSSKATPPTTPASNVIYDLQDGASFRMRWTNGNGQHRIVVIKQGSPVTAVPSNGTDYLASPTFGSGDEIAPGEFVVYDGNGNLFSVAGLQPNTTYYTAIFEYNGSSSTTEYLTTSTTGSTSTVAAPTVQASAVTITSVNGNSMKVSWTNGNGDKRIVIMKAGSPVDVNPTDLNNYNANSNFGSGAQIGTGNYVVMNGTSNNVTVTALNVSTTYYVAVFEANGSASPVYLTTTPATGNATTTARPTVAPTAAIVDLQDGTSLRLRWTNGNGLRRIVVAREGSDVDAVPVDGTDYIAGNTNANSPFNTAPEISAGQKVIFDGNGNIFTVTGLNPSTTYYFRVYEYDGTGTSIGYLTSSFASISGSTVSAPTTQASNLVFSNITGTAMTLSWTNGNGEKRVILAKQGSAVDGQPTDLVNPSASSNFGNGAQIGTGNYVVYNSSGTSVTLSNLTAGATYYFAIFEANGSSNPVYLTTSPATGNAATNNRPTVAASAPIIDLQDGNSLRLRWTNGNGSRRIVVARAGSAVDAIPADGTDYVAGNLNTANPFNTAPEISAGQKVIFDGNGNIFSVTGLNPSTTYYFRVYEYNGTGVDIAYLTASFASISGSTVSAPTNPASNLVFSGITTTSMNVQWTNGNGERRLVLAKAGSPVDAVPTDLTSYSQNTNFGFGTQVGSGNYVVYNSTGSSFTMTQLTLGTTYYFAVFEANGSSAPVFNTSSYATGSQTTDTHPTTPPSNLHFDLVEGNSMRMLWSAGNGTNRIIVAREGSPVDAVPVDGVDYLGATSSPFNTAPEISPGQKVIYDGNSTILNLTGLNPGATYYFRIYEYAGSGSSIGYLVSSYASGSQATVSTPTIAASSLGFTSVTSNSMVVGWTNGNGENRIVIMRQGSPVNVTPADFTTYTTNSNFGSGPQIGTGNYAVYKGTGANVTVNNLLPGTTYYVAVFEYNGNSAPVYMVTSAPTGQATTIGPPAVQATGTFTTGVAGASATLHWTNGSGNRRYVLMKAGSAVDDVPANNTDYFANSFFGSGDEIGTGNFVVFDGIQDFVTVTNLAGNTTYHFAVFEYNDFGATSQVLTTNPAIGNFTTGVLPVVLTSFSAQAKKGQVAVNWTTSQEANSDYFEVQRSSNGAEFVTAGRVKASGDVTRTTSYHFTDHQPFDGDNYYRLKQVDRDGKTSYSMIVRVKFTAEVLVRKMVNPVHDQLILELYQQPTAGSGIEVYDMNGQLLRRQALNNKLINLNISTLSQGSYLLLLRTAGKVETLRFVKQ